GLRRPPRPTLFPYRRSSDLAADRALPELLDAGRMRREPAMRAVREGDRVALRKAIRQRPVGVPGRWRIRLRERVVVQGRDAARRAEQQAENEAGRELHSGALRAVIVSSAIVPRS